MNDNDTGVLSAISGDALYGLIRRTLNQVDSRLTDHGLRVAFLVSRMLQVKGGYSLQDSQEICFLAMLHDVGAYKTEEIEQLVQFETNNIWAHSVYGYLFLSNFTPLQTWTQAVLYHHADVRQLEELPEPMRDVAQIFHLADRVDVFCLGGKTSRQALIKGLESGRGTRFYDHIVDLFLEAEKRFGLIERLSRPIEFSDVCPWSQWTREQAEAFLNLLIYAIDFRSEHTVTHTITVIHVSEELARLMKMGPRESVHIHYGAMLHDLGKIGIPVEILESPGKLSPPEMEIMKSHVKITEEILGGAVDPETSQIALRHHEKLDGSGYPLGLTAADLTVSQRIVAVADITSALLGVRSYKKAFSAEQTLSIIRDQADKGLLDAGIVAVLEEHFDEIVERVRIRCAPALETYRNIRIEYERLMKKYSPGANAKAQAI